MEFSMIVGFGLDLEWIDDYIDYGKVTSHMRKRFCNDMPEVRSIIDCCNVLIDYDMMNGIADLIADIDPFNRLIGSSHDYEQFFVVYPPSLPWDRKPEDAATEDEANKILLNAIRPFMKDETQEQNIVQAFGHLHEIL